MNDTYKALVDLDLILQDGDKMVALKLFLGAVDPTSPSSEKLHSKIREFTVLVERLVEAAQKACDNLNTHPLNKKALKRKD